MKLASYPTLARSNCLPLEVQSAMAQQESFTAVKHVNMLRDSAANMADVPQGLQCKALQVLPLLSGDHCEPLTDRCSATICQNEPASQPVSQLGFTSQPARSCATGAAAH